LVDNNEDVDHRYMMFSATFPKEARQVAKALLAEDHVRIRVGRIGSTHENIKQDVRSLRLRLFDITQILQVVWVEDGSKPEALVALLRSMPPARTLIFVNNKTTADWVDDHLFNNDFPSTSLHSARSQLEREDAMYVRFFV
jgi:ATP-dependent RNA helicase DDX3X